MGRPQRRDGFQAIKATNAMIGMDDEVIAMQELFSFRRTGFGRLREVQGHFTASGIRPKCSEKLAVYGYDLAPLAFAEV